MSILGRGSIKEKSKEDELRNSGNLLYAHLNDELHVLIEAVPPNSVQKLAAGATEVRKMLIPPVSDGIHTVHTLFTCTCNWKVMGYILYTLLTCTCN